MNVFHHEAMATSFEVRIHAEDGRYAGQAARAAFDLLDRIEGLLSRFRENSDISRVNRWAARRPVPVNPITFGLLLRCQELQRLTEGAFDIAAATNRFRRTATDAGCGPECRDFWLETGSRTIAFPDGNMRLDLGAVGKGFALDRMGALFREWDLNQVILNGGFSSILALDAPPGQDGWAVELGFGEWSVALHNQAAGASGIDRGEHIVDPRTGRLVGDRSSAWCLAPDATTADALSTAFMVLEPEAIDRVCERLPGISALVGQGKEVTAGGGRRFRSFGCAGARPEQVSVIPSFCFDRFRRC